MPGNSQPSPGRGRGPRILGEDITQIDDTTERVKRMVGRVLTGKGITRYEKGRYSLVCAEELSDSERDELLQLCRQRLDAFREQRGDDVFAHRSRHRTPISGSVKYRVLTRAKGHCECCGARLLLSNARTSELWRWTTSCPRTRGARTISATCRPSVSAAMPARGMLFAYPRGHNRLSWLASHARRERDAGPAEIKKQEKLSSCLAP